MAKQGSLSKKVLASKSKNTDMMPLDINLNSDIS